MPEWKPRAAEGQSKGKTKPQPAGGGSWCLDSHAALRTPSGRHGDRCKGRRGTKPRGEEGCPTLSSGPEKCNRAGKKSGTEKSRRGRRGDLRGLAGPLMERKT